jgi:hypothetical protein
MLRYSLHRNARSEAGIAEGAVSSNRILPARLTWRSRKDGKVSG